jgi:hypothetical protein
MLTLLFAAVGGMALMALLVAAVVFTWPKRSRFRMPDWISYLRGEVPWAKPPTGTMVEGSPAGHEYYPYSRHDLAECGMTCPLCQTEVAEQGDFSGVRKAKIDGHINEVIKCPGIIHEEGKKPRPCMVWLVASPDTEHGDHLGDDGSVQVTGDIPEYMYLFKRTTAEQVLKERWGMDLKGSLNGVEVPEAERPAVGGASSECIKDAPIELAAAIAQGAVGGTTPAYKHIEPDFSTKDTAKHPVLESKL